MALNIYCSSQIASAVGAKLFPPSHKTPTHLNTVVDILYRDIFTRFGAPRALDSDRGRQFLSRIVSALCQIFKVKKLNTSPYHPQTNSTCERLNSFLEQLLRAYCDKGQENWPKYIPGILIAYRATPCTWSTTFSPYYLLFGRDMLTPLDSEVLTPTTTGTAEQYVKDLRHNLEMAQQIAKEHIAHNSAYNKRTYDKNSKVTKFQLGQSVLLKDEHIKVGESSKLHRPDKGPYYIVDIGPPPTYQLRDAKTHTVLRPYVHANRLKPYSHPQERQYNNMEQDQPDNVEQQPEPEDQSTDDPPMPDNPPATNPNSTQPDPDDNLPSDLPVDAEITKIIKATNYQGKKMYRVKLKDKSESTWVYAEQVPEELKSTFHINKTQDEKNHKRRKQTM